jgi:hypothetical protein
MNMSWTKFGARYADVARANFEDREDSGEPWSNLGPTKGPVPRCVALLRSSRSSYIQYVHFSKSVMDLTERLCLLNIKSECR